MPELIPGLVSITFRKLTPQEVIDLVVKTGLKAIEWGGDVHAPHGDIARAKEVKQQTLDAGLTVAAYGSYYRIGASEAKGLSFESVLDSAVALGAPTIRVWAGEKGSADTSPQERKAVIDDALRIAEMAGKRDVAVSLEYHANTLTDARDSVRQLMDEISHPNLDFLWQPSNGEAADLCIARLHDVLPRVRHIHVFHWWPTNSNWRPLAEGEDRWPLYLEIVRSSGRSMYCLIEFVRDHSVDQFLEDAATLRRWVEA
jgi:sugar phosphate isomerase/epimerase